MKKTKNSSAILSENLRKVIAERRISARAAAEICGVSSSTFAQWLAGTAPTDLLPIHRFCQAVGISFEWVITGHEASVSNLKIEDAFDVSPDPTLSGFFEISIRRIKPRGSQK